MTQQYMNKPESNSYPGTQDLPLALDDAYVALVKVLHLNGSLKISDLANELGNTIDFRLKNGNSKEQFPYLIQIYEKILAIEPRLERLQALRSPPPSEPPA